MNIPGGDQDNNGNKGGTPPKKPIRKRQSMSHLFNMAGAQFVKFNKEHGIYVRKSATSDRPNNA